MSKKISQLQVATNRTITPNDLFVGAGLVDAKMKNFKLTVENFCYYYTATSIYKLTPFFFNLRDVSSYVSNKTYDISDISSLTFDIYGRVTNLATTSGTNKETENIVGDIVTTKPGDEWTGYFNDSVAGTVTGGTITSWANLFDKSYAGFKKTIITYTQARNDSTGNNKFDVCEHKVYIYWDHGGTKSVKACASGQYPAAVGPDGERYNTKTYMIYNLFNSVDGYYSKRSKGEYTMPGTAYPFNVLLDIDIENSKIDKLPLPCYLGKGQETCSISMTVESFV
ncbi:MAG: hypothetical protein V3W20_10010 [Candidatus Neomarinimicrobiota bacterium]